MPRIGIVLGQVGTPDAPTPEALRSYLRQFLGDPRVIEVNPLVRTLIVRIGVPRRAPESAELYRRIWKPEGSPLLLTTRAQAARLEEALGSGVKVAAGMRCGNPSIESAIRDLLAWGAERLLLFPMFPQYSGATTGSLAEEFFRILGSMRVVPPVRVVPPYYQHPGYIGAVTGLLRETMEGAGPMPDRILFSFHGIPMRYIQRGDPYRDHVEATVRAVTAGAGVDPGRFVLAYQSKYGRAQWLEPATVDVLEELGRRNLGRIVVACPGFTADCLETIDEIGNLARKTFVEAGGGRMDLVPGLDTHPAWIEGMVRIAREELAGWM